MKMEDAKKSLDQLLEEVTVDAPGMWENDDGPKDWYAVSTAWDGGIIAYFRDEESAFRFRLDYINGLLNPLKGE